MTKKHKRPHKDDANVATPTTSNRKKIDDKITPTKTTPNEKDQEMDEIAPKTLTFNEDADNQQQNNQNNSTSDKKNSHKGFTSYAWCASGIRCKNDKSSAAALKSTERCLHCHNIAHPECICDNECLTCNKNLLWNSYTRRWIKVIPSSTTTTNESSLQQASQPTFGDRKWCGSKELCRNKHIPAKDNNTCTICRDHIHSECINAGEQESEYICLGCHTTKTNNSDDDRPISKITQEETAIISEEVTNNTQPNITIQEPDNEQMDIELLTKIPAKETVLTKIDEGKESVEQAQPNKKPPKKYPVAPGALRITSNPGVNNSGARPNTSSKSGDFLITRVELRVNITNATEPENNLKKLHRHLKEILTTLSESDPTVKVIPWKEQQQYTEIDASNIPNYQSGITRFFNRIMPTNEGPAYADVRIKHTRQFGDIMNDIQLWLSNHRHGIHFQTLQCENTTNIGWLLWSFRRIDTKKLEDEIWALYKINVALKYQIIATSTNRSEKGNRDAVKALHIWINRTDADKATQTFHDDVYSMKSVHFPLGIVLRFVPHIGRFKEKIERFRNAWAKQQILLNGIENNRNLSATSWEIISLDTKKGPYESLRKIIMGIESKRTPGEHLFQSVDCSYYRGNEVLFSFLPRHENEAREFVANLVPYMLNTHPDAGVKSFFHPEAVDRAMESEWDETQNVVITALDKYIDDFEIVDDYGDESPSNDFTMDCTAINSKATSQAMSKIERLITGEDADSIGTMITNGNLQQNFRDNHTPSSVTASTSANNFDSNNSIAGKSAATSASRALTEADLLIDKRVTTMETILFLLAKRMGVDVNEIDNNISQTGATLSNEDGCRDK
jgi:hypothetical protein